MDLGATICTPRNPACGICPLMTICEARKSGIAETLPQKTPKKAKPTRFGIAWVATRDDGAVLLNRRPEKGLLGGMTEVPGSDWTQDKLSADAITSAPLAGNWRDVGEARHTFTHFHLILTVKHAEFSEDAKPDRGRWVPGEHVSSEALSTRFLIWGPQVRILSGAPIF